MLLTFGLFVDMCNEWHRRAIMMLIIQHLQPDVYAYNLNVYPLK